MNLKEQREALRKALATIKVKVDDGTATDEDFAEVDTKSTELAAVDAKIESANRLDQYLGSKAPEPETTGKKAPASLGEHFLAESGVKGGFTAGQRASFTAPEIAVKAATDTIVTPTGTELRETVTDVDLNVVKAPRRASLADLFGTGQISGNAIRYFIEGALEGGFGVVAENGQKPQFSATHPTPQVDALTKIAGWYKESDEILEDYPWLVSSINDRALYALLLAEEDQLLNGSGSGANLRGLLNRTGVQVASATTATLADELFKASTAVQTASGLTADAVVLNPADYQTLRLAKDGNGQYYGGGMFQGQYGNGTMIEQPPVWGLRTVTTPAVAQGTAVVGAFRQGATVYRKGGVRIEATNSHDDDFTNNRITVRIEERVALAVRYPSAFVNITIGI